MSLTSCTHIPSRRKIIKERHDRISDYSSAKLKYVADISLMRITPQIRSARDACSVVPVPSAEQMSGSEDAFEGAERPGTGRLKLEYFLDPARTEAATDRSARESWQCGRQLQPRRLDNVGELGVEPDPLIDRPQVNLVFQQTAYLLRLCACYGSRRRLAAGYD